MELRGSLSKSIIIIDALVCPGTRTGACSDSYTMTPHPMAAALRGAQLPAHDATTEGRAHRQGERVARVYTLQY